MELSLLLMSKLLSMMLWGVVGFILVKLDVLKIEDSRPFSKLVIYVLAPAMLLCSFQVELTKQRMFGLISSVLFALFIHIVWIVISRLLQKPLRLTAVDQGTLIYTNCGNLLLPLIAMILDEEHVFYTIGFLFVFNVLIWVHGSPLIRGENKPEFLKGFINPCVICIILSLVLSAFGFKMPEILDTAFTGLSNMVGPTSMLVIGMLMAGADLKAVFTSKKTYFITFGRLIVYPMIIMALLWVSRLTVIFPELREVFLISMMAVAAPPAAMVSQFATIYQKDEINAGLYNVMGVIFCIVTIPLMIGLYQVLF